MTLLANGYWNSQYWAENYWNDNYWPNCGLITTKKVFVSQDKVLVFDAQYKNSTFVAKDN